MANSKEQLIADVSFIFEECARVNQMVAEHNGLSLDGYRFDVLGAFYELTSRSLSAGLPDACNPGQAYKDAKMNRISKEAEESVANASKPH